MTITSPCLTDVRVDSTASPQGNWLNVLAHIDPKYGGMSAAVPALGSAINRTRKHSVTLAAFCDHEEDTRASGANWPPVHIMPLGRGSWFKDASRRRVFRQLVRDASGVHIHGLWEQSTLAAAAAARSLKTPYLISAHGMLQPWALNNKKWKKIIYGTLIERANLKHASCLHALTQAEANDYRAYGLSNPIAVVPNGVDLPADVDREAFFDRFPHLRQKRLVLFLSRIHFKKGLDILTEAWASVAKGWPDAHLVLAGPDFEGTQTAIEAFIETAGLKERVTFTGMLEKRLKWSAFSNADCFVLPSYSEGLSVSVLEAMGMGVPVIVSRECNVPEVQEKACGWVIGANVSELVFALNECLAASSASMTEMGANGRQLVAGKYSWPVVGIQMSSVYNWLQGGSAPVDVLVDFGGNR